MSVKPVISPLLAAANLPVEQAGAKPLAVLVMAPVSLTPLASPLPAPAVTAPAMRARSPASDRRQAFFADKQRSLLERLQQSEAETASNAAPLSAAQRSTCAVVLQAIAAAVSSNR